MWPFLAALIATAGAPSPRPDLLWEAPSGCPPAAVVLGNVQRIMAESGRPRTGAHAGALVVVTGGDTWQASVLLEVDGRTTERRFEAESCDAIAAAAALILALAADDGLDDLALPSTPARSVPAATAPPPWGPPPVDAPKAAPVLTSALPATPARHPVHRSLFASAEGLVDFGTLPNGSAAGVDAALGRRWTTGQWRASSLGGASFFPTQQLVYSPMGGYIYGDFWLAGAFARGCLAAAVWRLELGPCLGGELEVMHGSSSASNPGAVKTQTRPWFAAQAAAVASLNVARSTALSLRAGVTVPTTHPNFGTPNVDVIVHQIPTIAYRLGLGVEHSF